MKLTDPGSSFLPFLKTGEMSAFPRCSDTSPRCYDQSRVIESGLAMTSAGSLSTSGCIPSGFDAFLLFQRQADPTACIHKRVLPV